MNIKLVFLCVLLVSLTGCKRDSVRSSSIKESSAPTERQKQTEREKLNSGKHNKSSAGRHSGSGTLSIRPIKFNQDAFIKDAVKRECDLDGKLAQFIEDNATGQYSNIVTGASKHAKGQVLTITIEQVNGGRGRGGWGRRSLWGGGRGGNMVGVEGKLTQGGKTLGNFKALRVTGGGAFAGFKGACAMLGRCVKTLGSDIAGWLENPTRNATLGDY
jgi:hypothetical protein